LGSLRIRFIGLAEAHSITFCVEDSAAVDVILDIGRSGRMNGFEGNHLFMAVEACICIAWVGKQ